jgi:hypothetical protein
MMAEQRQQPGYTKLPGSLTDRANPLALSLYAYQALALLRKGSAFYVRGVWRVRALLSLLEKGLVERVETENAFRITAAGCTVYQRRRRAYYREALSSPISPELPKALTSLP